MNARRTMQIRLLAMMSAAAGEITRSASTWSTADIAIQVRQTHKDQKGESFS
jgi:hypothetical protein